MSSDLGIDLEAGDEALDRLARLASRLLGTPVSLVSLIKGEHQHFLGQAGLGDLRRTPLAASICRVAVETDAPVVIDDAETDSRAPRAAIDDYGVRAYAGYPVRVGDQPIGAMCAIDTEPHHWSAVELSILDELSSTANALLDARLAQATLTRRARRDGEVSAMLQRSLLPQALPVMDGLRLAAAFQPAAQIVGGDFYDAFRVPGDRLAFMLGDVVGHGLEAAAAAGQLRNVVRGAAIEDPEPAFVAQSMNDAVDVNSPLAYSSVLYGVVDPAGGCLEFINLGHPGALLRHAGGGEIAELGADHPVLGVRPRGSAMTGRTVALGHGDLLVTYTDGLVERRRGGDARRVERIRELMDLEPDPDGIVAALIAEFVTPTMRDDVAILALGLDQAGRVAP